MTETLAHQDPYEVLRVPFTASAPAIQAAYRALARVHHPDVAGDSGMTRMIEINAAWEILRDPARRAAWDREHGRSAGSSPVDGPRTPIFDRTRSRRSGGSAANGGWRVGPNGEGAAGPPPGRPSGSVLDFGRHRGWSLGEIARVDPGYLEWLELRPDGQPYLGEIDALLRKIGFRTDRFADKPESERKGWFRKAQPAR